MASRETIESVRFEGRNAAEIAVLVEAELGTDINEILSEFSAADRRGPMEATITPADGEPFTLVLFSKTSLKSRVDVFPTR